MARPEPGDGRPPQSPLAMLGFGLDLAVAVALFLFVGYKLDGWLGTAPWLMLAGALCGMTVGFYSMYRRLAAGQERK